MASVRDWECYKEVRRVFGEVEAKIELEKVLNSGIEVHEERPLHQAFCWGPSPQGLQFWRYVWDRSRVPEEEDKGRGDTLVTCEALRDLLIASRMSLTISSDGYNIMDDDTSLQGDVKDLDEALKVARAKLEYVTLTEHFL